MTEPQDDLWRDVSVVLKHIRFIVAVFAVAILAAVISGLATSSQSRAESEAELDIKPGVPIFGAGQTLPTLDTYEELATGEEVAAAAAREVGLDTDEVIERRTVSTQEGDPRDRESVDRLTVEATGASGAEARSLAVALMDAFVAAVEAVDFDPREVEALREQEELALQRLNEFDDGPALELAQVQADLTRNRTSLATLEGDITAIDQALTLLEAEGARPLPELIVAVSSILGGAQASGLEQASSAEEMREGLQLRRQISEALIVETQVDVAELAQREQELQLLTAEQSAALTVYTTAVRNRQAEQLAGVVSRTDITVTVDGLDTSSDAKWPARLGAAGAFALVAGVAGAFALEFLMPYWRRWRGRSATTSQPKEA